MVVVGGGGSQSYYKILKLIYKHFGFHSELYKGVKCSQFCFSRIPLAIVLRIQSEGARANVKKPLK